MSSVPGPSQFRRESAAAESAERTEASRAVHAAAAELFADHGYNQVTVRDIAARAGLSPAMVMKSAGSKRELFLRTAIIATPPLPDEPLGRLGEALVRDLLDRAEQERVEPLTRALVLRLSAPDPESVRERFVAGYFAPLAERLGGHDDAHLTAELVVATLVGLAANVRIFDAPTMRTSADDVAERYGAVVQGLIDSCGTQDGQLTP